MAGTREALRAGPTAETNVATTPITIASPWAARMSCLGSAPMVRRSASSRVR